jgi:hypothetical protein
MSPWFIILAEFKNMYFLLLKAFTRKDRNLRMAAVRVLKNYVFIIRQMIFYIRQCTMLFQRF